MTKVTKIIILLIVTISLLCSVEALQCVVCTKHSSAKSCESSKETCEAKIDQECFLVTVSTGKHHLKIRKCSSNCTNAIPNQSQHACCDSHSLCKKLQGIVLSWPVLLRAVH
ncbi:prostate and testis expressed protein 14-like isoform X1 [Peromyscus maniculatus bairdii]|uniref:prostate and testis expressed protein 14-like isoform X1 n=1 Tax=Peromyscus maniculatus bairdii TaxID=230844 RepID=UPI003FD072B4